MKAIIKKTIQFALLTTFTAVTVNAFADTSTDSNPPSTYAYGSAPVQTDNANSVSDAPSNYSDDSGSAYNHHKGYFVSGNMGIGLIDEINKSGRVDSGFTGFGIGLNIGDQFTTNFGAEMGASVYTLPFSTLSIYDLVMKGVLPLNQRGEFFGKVGVGVARLRVCFLGCDSHQRVGPAVGLGFAYNFTHRWAGTLEYNAVYLSSPYEKGLVGGLTLGVTRHFDA